MEYTEQQVIELYVQFDSARPVAEQFGISTETVYRILKRNGVKRTGNRTKQKSRVKSPCGALKFCPSMFAMLFDVAGMTSAEIRDAIGCNMSSVMNVLYKRGLVVKKSKSKYQIAYENTDWSCTSVAEAARIHGVSQSGLNKWMRRHHPECCRTKEEHNAELAAKYEFDIPKRVSDWCGKFNIEVLRKTGTSSNRRYDVMCKVCGEEFNRSVSVGRYEVECPKCKARKIEARRFAKAEQLVIRFPGTPYIPIRRDQVLECEICGKAYTDNDWAKWRDPSAKLGIIHKTCSPACDATKRKQRRSEKVTIPWHIVAKHYNTMDCALCGCPVDPSDYEVTDGGAFKAGPMYPSTDHIVEWCISHDGSMENSQLAHRKCNWEKEAARARKEGAA